MELTLQRTGARERSVDRSPRATARDRTLFLAESAV